MAERIRQEVEAIGGVALIIVDTAAAFFEGDDENSNVQQGAYARMLRGLVTLPGGPCVLVPCHPTKNAADDALLPRGGYHFLTDVDGNLSVIKDDMTLELHWQGKFRGPDFAAMNFLLRTVTHERLVDRNGKLIPTVVASVLSEAAKDDMSQAARADEDRLLKALDDNPASSPRCSDGPPPKAHRINQRCTALSAS
jgi:hypothetical protein